MGTHIIDGEFQSDKYPTCPRGKVPLSVKDPTAQDLLWVYAQRRRAADAEFSDDLETALRNAGYSPVEPSESAPASLAKRPVDHAIATQDCPTCRAEIGTPCRVGVQGRLHDGAHRARLDALLHPPI